MNSLFFQSLFLGLIFFMAGINKIGGFNGTVSGLEKKLSFNIFPKIIFQLIIAGVIIVEILAPILMTMGTTNMLNNNYGKLGIFSLLIFTILATVLYHFPSNKAQFMPFLKNLAIIGGLWALSNSYTLI